MSSIIDKLTAVGDFIKEIPVAIANLPTAIIDGIKNIFIPDTEVLQQKYDDTLAQLKNKLGITIINMDMLFDTEARPADAEADYNIHGVGTFHINFINYDFVVQGVEFFRPYIRGLIVLLLAVFNIRELMSMFGLDNGEMRAFYENSKARDDK